MLSLVVAVSENGVIGNDGEIPWHLRTDLRRFKSFTEGHTVVMGRKTFDSIVAQLDGPLPNRQNVVITRNHDFSRPDVHIAGEMYFKNLQPCDEEIFVIGGSEIYALALPYATIIHLTRVHAFVEGDTYFPSVTNRAWELANMEYHPISSKDDRPFTFLTYMRL